MSVLILGCRVFANDCGHTLLIAATHDCHPGLEPGPLACRLNALSDVSRTPY